MLKLRAFAFLLLCLSVVAPCFADSFEVTFLAEFAYQAPPFRTVEGSFVWDTSTETFSNININDNFGGSYPIFDSAIFAVEGNSYGYPAGALNLFQFSTADSSRAIQMDGSFHAFLQPPLLPAPGTYGEPFFLGLPNTAPLVASRGEVTVTQVPEPQSLFLLALGFLATFLVIARPRMRP